MGRAIDLSQQDMHIELSDMLGEGEGGWDSDPRVPSASLNCMTWLQWVLAMAYRPTDLSGLDAIRYYNSEVSLPPESTTLIGGQCWIQDP